MKKSLLLICFLVMPLIVMAQGKIPQFKDYPIQEIYTGKTAKPVITKSEKRHRTRITNGAKGKPDFAGRYIISVWGCGFRCLTGVAIDAKTGKVHWIPGSINSWEGDENLYPIENRLNSRLLILSGNIDQKGMDGSGLNSHYYEFKNGKFVYIKTIKRKSTE